MVVLNWSTRTILKHNSCIRYFTISVSYKYYRCSYYNFSAGFAAQGHTLPGLQTAPPINVPRHLLLSVVEKMNQINEGCQEKYLSKILQVCTFSPMETFMETFILLSSWSNWILIIIQAGMLLKVTQKTWNHGLNHAHFLVFLFVYMKSHVKKWLQVKTWTVSQWKKPWIQAKTWRVASLFRVPSVLPTNMRLSPQKCGIFKML